ncbi:MAG: amidohydrolase family protein [Planctomycetota bacterium]|jgi:imidazolonepropionase-like amidohydrolase
MRKAWFGFRVCAAFAICAVLSYAQDPSESGKAEREPGPGQDLYLIKGAKIHTGKDGEVIQGDILVRNGKIAALGEEFDPPFPVPRFEAKGYNVIPGLCDAYSAFLLDVDEKAAARIDGDVLDSFDRFDDETMLDALSRGVTSLALTPPSREGVSGRISVVKLIPGVPLEEMVLERDAALKAGLGVKNFGDALLRLKSAASLARQFKGAKDYREAWESYEEALEEYMEKLEARAKEEASSKEKDDKAGDEETTEEKESDKKGPDKKGPEKKGKDKKKDKGKKGFEKVQEGRDPSFAPDELKRRGGKRKPQETAKEKAPEADQEPAKEGELQKPRRPKFDPMKELLLDAMDGELALHFEVHRAADILGVLEIAKRFHLDGVLLGCTEGYLVMDEIKESGLPVILEEVERPLPEERNVYLNHDRRSAARLDAQGIPIAIASGRNAASARFLRLNAAAAAGAGLDPHKALEAITSAPARILGVSDRIGTLEKGKDADLVILDGDPLDSDSRVVQVMINGKKVFPRAE